MPFHGVFKAAMDQAKVSPHTKLLRRGGVIWREIDDTGRSGEECYFYDDWLPQHDGIVLRAMRRDEEEKREIQCTKCISKYGPCDDRNCWFNRQREAR